MRVIAGRFKSRRLTPPPRGLKLRPTSDKLRETLFNILGGAVEGCMFVDAYAGTGAVGIEALSRGAREVVFLENHSRAVAALKRNLEALKIATGAELLIIDAVRGFEKLAASRRVADFIFLDPPYANTDDYDRALEFLSDSRLLSPFGRAIFEHDRKRKLPEWTNNLELVRILEQGDAALSFYRLARAA